MLTSIRRSLVSHVEELHKPRPRLKAGLKAHMRNLSMYQSGSNNIEIETDVTSVLESALLSLGRCIDLVRPAGLHVASVPRSDWVKALKALEHSMSQIRHLCDPDRPLSSSEWSEVIHGKI